MRRSLRILEVVAVVVFAVVTLPACGAGGVVPPRPLDVNASAVDVYAGAVEAMANVTSYRWVTDIEAVISETGDTWTEHVEGVWSAVDNYDFVATSYQPTAKLGTDQLPFVYHYRVVEGRFFAENEDGWSERDVPCANGVPRFNSSSVLPDLSEIGFSRNVTSAPLYALVGSELWEDSEGGTNRTDVELGIDHRSLRVVSVQQTFTQDEGSTYRIDTRFFRYNEAVTIELPERRTNLPGSVTPVPTATHISQHRSVFATVGLCYPLKTVGGVA